MTTSAKFLVITTTATGTRIHRITCKRKGEGTRLDLATSGVIVGATAASCCRPKDVPEHVAQAKAVLDFPQISIDAVDGTEAYDDAVLGTSAPAPEPSSVATSQDELGEDGRGADDEPTDTVAEPADGLTVSDELLAALAKRSTKAPKPKAAKKPEPSPELVAATDGEVLAVPGKRVFMIDDAKVSKQYWNAFGRDGGTGVAKALGVAVEARGADFSLWITDPEQANADRAAQAIVTMWVDGWAEFKLWRKADEIYKALPRTTNARFRAEQVWLRDFAASTTNELSGVL